MARTRPTYSSLTEVLRDALLESEMSYKAIERETGVLRQSLMKFAEGEQSLRLDMADRLAEFFEIEIARRKAD